MAITINGSGTISGITAGGLPDGVITADDLAAGVGGKVLQVVQGIDTTGTQTSSTSFVATGLTATITPTASSSKILIMVAGGSLYAANNTFCIVTVYRGATDLFSAITYGATNQRMRSGSDAATSNGVVYLDSPNTTNATVYKVYVRSHNGGTVEYPSPTTNTHGTITLMEIAA